MLFSNKSANRAKKIEGFQFVKWISSGSQIMCFRIVSGFPFNAILVVFVKS